MPHAPMLSQRFYELVVALVAFHLFQDAIQVVGFWRLEWRELRAAEPIEREERTSQKGTGAGNPAEEALPTIMTAYAWPGNPSI